MTTIKSLVMFLNLNDGVCFHVALGALLLTISFSLMF